MQTELRHSPPLFSRDYAPRIAEQRSEASLISSQQSSHVTYFAGEASDYQVGVFFHD